MPLTLTDIVHVPPAAMEPPVRPTLLLPANATAVPDPHVVAAFGAAAINKFVGSASLTFTPVRAMAPVATFVSVTVSTDVPPAGIVLGENVLEMPAPGGTSVLRALVFGRIAGTHALDCRANR